jgi:hypothetical protein
MEIAMNPSYMPHFKVKNALSKLLNNWKCYKQIFVLHLNWFVNFFLYRIVLDRLIETCTYLCITRKSNTIYW